MKAKVGVIILTVLGTFWASAAPITLNPSLLPSSQGWTYAASGLHAGDAETDIFSVDGPVLSMSTMGLPYAVVASSALYTQLDVVNESLPTVLEWTSRTLEHEWIEGRPLGFCAGFSVGNLLYVAGILSDRIGLVDGAEKKYIFIDAADYHTYRIETVAGTSSYDFYIDGVFETSASASSGNQPNRLFFGDGTGAANSSADIIALEFTQIPEPNVIALLGVFGGGVVFVRRLFPAI